MEEPNVTAQLLNIPAFVFAARSGRRAIDLFSDYEFQVEGISRRRVEEAANLARTVARFDDVQIEDDYSDVQPDPVLQAAQEKAFPLQSYSPLTMEQKQAWKKSLDDLINTDPYPSVTTCGTYADGSLPSPRDMTPIIEMSLSTPTKPKFHIPPSPAKRYDEWPVLKPGDYALVSDMHIPMHHAPTLIQLMESSERAGLKKLVVIGDTLDGNQLHPKRGAGEQHSRRWQEDVELAEEVYKALLAWFEEIHVLSGNHDRWAAQHMRGQVDAKWHMEKLFHSVKDRVHFTEYEQAEVISGGKPFRLLHGANYSGPNPLGIANGLSQKFQSGIVMGHQHHACEGFDRSGRHQLVCLGGAHDSTRMSYVNISPKTNPQQTRSFGLLIDGTVHVTTT